MAKIQELVNSIESLSKRDFTQLRVWFVERDHEQWDEQVKRDSDSGKLDFLLHEAAKGKRNRPLKKL